MKRSEAACWEEVGRSDALMPQFIFPTYNLNEIFWRNMNYHRESIFTGQSDYWRFKSSAGKNGFFKLLEVDSVFA